MDCSSVRAIICTVAAPRETEQSHIENHVMISYDHPANELPQLGATLEYSRKVGNSEECKFIQNIRQLINPASTMGESVREVKVTISLLQSRPCARNTRCRLN